MATTRQTLAAAVVAALPLLTATMPTPVQAQDHPRARALEPRIEGFNVDEVRRMDPGAELNFDLFGTPGGYATVRIDGATRNLTLTKRRRAPTRARTRSARTTASARTAPSPPTCA
jgi:hypothetical protein